MSQHGGRPTARSLLILAALFGPSFEIAAQELAPLQESCNGGDPVACHEIGAMFRTGESVERDAMRASVYFERACNQGVLPSCEALGQMYQRGEGVGQDLRRALALLEQACEGSEFSACTTLGALYLDGRQVAQDFDLALEFLDRACAGDSPLGCANLGVLHQRGLGVEEDEARAMELFGLACRGGVAQACSLATDGRWTLERFELEGESLGATARARATAGGPANLRVSCTPEGTSVTVDWGGEFGDDALPLTTALGAEATEADDWAFDLEENRHTYVGDARALIATLSRLEGLSLYAAIPEHSAAFPLEGLTVMTGALGVACGW